jgi:hypothetical protein
MIVPPELWIADVNGKSPDAEKIKLDKNVKFQAVAVIENNLPEGKWNILAGMMALSARCFFTSS